MAKLTPDESFNTQPPEGGWALILPLLIVFVAFQHTAARRRLGNVKTHWAIRHCSFNTQPPEGGWSLS